MKQSGGQTNRLLRSYHGGDTGDIRQVLKHVLDEKGYKYTYFENEEGHIWKNWRIYLTEFTQLIFK